MPPLSSPHLFALCQHGAERDLKEDVARRHEALRFAFSRPGFVTFKVVEGSWGEGDALASPFARRWGASLGRVDASPEEAAGVILQRAAALAAEEPLRLHVFERELHSEARTPRGFVPGALAAPMQAALQGGPFLPGVEARPGERVLDVIALEPGAWWLGVHRHDAPLSRWPGAAPPVVVPAEAPSRVYAKLSEALDWSGVTIRPGDVVLDIGCAPGGGTWALLERGAHVVGVDPAEMDPAVLASPRFTHLRRPFEVVTAAELPARVDWLVFDVNLSPMLTLKALRRLGASLEGLRGAVVTLKLNTDEHPARVPWMLEQLERMGLQEVRATQLPSNRREVCAAGFTAPGRARGAR